MKKALFKDNLIQIKKTFKRFLSILIMALLGVGFFAGIKATGPDMENTLDTYLDNQNVFDVMSISTGGITISDIESLKQINGVKEIMPSYSVDAKININEKNIIAKTISVPTKEMNNLILKNGRLPEQKDECVVEKKFLQMANLEIGGEINLETDEDSILKNNKFKIVGIVESPLYISRERGTSKLGSGLVDCYIYVNQEAYDSEVFTECYITLEGAKETNFFRKDYDKILDKVKTNIEDLAKEREEIRYTEIKNKANEKIKEAEDKLLEEKANAEKKIKEAEDEINSSESKIEQAERKLNTQKQTADKEFKSAETQIASAEQELLSNEQQFNANKQTMLNKIAEAESGLETINENIKNVNLLIENINKKYEGVTDEKLLEQKNQALQEAQANKTILEAKKQEISKKINEGKTKITQTEQSIISGKQELENKKQELQKTKTETYNKIESARIQIATNKQKLEDAKVKLEEEKSKAESEISKAEKELEDAKNKINDIEKPNWYVLDRESNMGFIGFKQDTERIANIGKVFPLVFFIVATLISLTSMTRMVEEQRVQIGTLKALGYKKSEIAMKYITYALLATTIGSIIGMLIGFNMLPRIIYSMYQMMYTIGDIIIEFNIKYALIGFLIMATCIVGATIYSCISELRSMPAELMRPKSPKPGKRVFLEKMPFIWKKLNFTKKVTIRNLFRYKKRFLMTIIGICGCTALILAGFGLKNSISTMIPLQYGELFKYDISISLKDKLAEDRIDNKIVELKNINEIEDVLKINMQSGKLLNNDMKEDIQIVIPSDKEKILEFIDLRESSKGEKYKLNDEEIIITEKLAKILKIKKGDKAKLINADDIEVEVKVANITENYLYHYVYMSNSLYKKLYNEEINNNIILTKTQELIGEEEEKLVKTILEDKDIIEGVTKNSTAISMMDDTMKSLDSVVVVLIVSAGMLAFVVLYNLSNVNISERIRELATIKVLGFYDKEVYDYVTKETVILTAIGIIVGLVIGYFLNLFILETCELDILTFNKIINPMSYIYSAAITIVFAVIVNITTYFVLKKIDMIESLKSIE